MTHLRNLALKLPEPQDGTDAVSAPHRKHPKARSKRTGLLQHTESKLVLAVDPFHQAQSAIAKPSWQKGHWKTRHGNKGLRLLSCTHFLAKCNITSS